MTVPLNVVSPKSLERQLKIVEARMGELQSEIRELEKVRTACLVLLGSPAEFAETEESPTLESPLRPSRKKLEKPVPSTEPEALPGIDLIENAPTTELSQ